MRRTTARTKDELIYAVNHQYDIIYLEGPNVDELIAMGKHAGLKITGSAAALIAIANITMPAIVFIGAGIAAVSSLFKSASKAKFMKYTIDSDGSSFYYRLK